MKGYCSKCREFRGDGFEWGITLRPSDNFPVCQKCSTYVEVSM